MKSVILITVDCLRSDHLNCYGYKPKTSPYISKLAQKGLIFTQMYANSSYTCASVASLITSTYPFDFGEYFEFSTPAAISRKRTLLSQVLKRYGYSCGLFHDNPYLSPFFGYDRGFDASVDFGAGKEKEGMKERLSLKGTILTRNPKVRRLLSRVNKLFLLYKRWFRGNTTLNTDAETIIKAASKWVRSVKQPYFLWCHLMDAHFPYSPKHEALTSPELTKAKTFYIISKSWALKQRLTSSELGLFKSLYDIQIASIDKTLERYLPNMISNASEDPIVIITADHGEEFMENGVLGHQNPLSDLLLHVPLIMTGGNLEHATVKYRASLIDLAPTILDLVGIRKFDNFKGTSLLKLKHSRRIVAQGIFKDKKHQRTI